MKTVLSCLLITSVACTTFAKSGEVTTYFSKIHAVCQDGKYDNDSQHISQCIKQYHQFINRPIKISYTIVPQTLYETATATIQGSKTTLHPEGLSTSYAFISDKSMPGVQSIIVNISKSFDNPQAAMLLKGNSDYNCSVSTATFF